MYESYVSVYSNNSGAHLTPSGKGFEIEFDFNKNSQKEYRLHTVGETSLFYQWRNELNYPELYQQITDVLDGKHAEKARYCIDFSSSDAKNYARRLYKKEVCNPVILAYIPLKKPDKIWKMGIWAKGKQIRVEKNGYLRMRVDVNFVSDEKSPYDTVISPDETYIIDFPEGSFDFACFEKTFEVKDREISSFGIWIEGLLYTGELYIETPFLVNCGYNLINDFYTPVSNRENFNWTGQNLSRKEWPEFRVTLNGKKIYEGEIFERCHRHSEWEIKLPAKFLESKNTLRYELISQYHEALAYDIYSVGIIEENGGLLSVVATSQAGTKGGYAYCLVKTNEDNVSADIKYLTENISGEERVCFKESGLHGIKVFCKEVCRDAEFVITCRNKEIKCVIPRVVLRQEDGIHLGTGDMVYVNNNLFDTENFLCWYLSNNIGNMLTLRPAYRWSGTRSINAESIAMVKRVLSELGISYVWMTDGRELPGLCCNPDDSVLEGDGYLGRQNHERDGKAYYWGVRDKSLSHSQLQFYDMMTYERMENEPFSQFPSKEYSYDKNGVYSAVEPYYPTDVTELESHTVKRLSHWRTAQRHTGPSYMQKYLVKAGYSFVGAETMYSNTEMLMAIMRGVSNAWNINGFGVHHALQWSTTPHDSPSKYRRFYLMLRLSYMLGATQINTEEGLWHLEEFFATFNRFSIPCMEYAGIHRDFMNYISTHSRQGKFYTPFAFIHGKCDGTLGFGTGNMWGVENGFYSDAEKSWETARVFYPDAQINDAIYLHPCPEEHPVGFYSSTPLGNVDIIPIEAPVNVFENYRVLAFAGYNLRDEKYESALKDYVSKGGTLVLTLAHLTNSKNVQDIANNNLCFDKLPFSKGKPEFVMDSVNGNKIDICTNIISPCKVYETTDAGRMLVAEYSYGAGRVILFNTSAYPGNNAISKLYQKYMVKLMQDEISKENIWITTKDKVEFSVYSHNECKIIYMLAVDWYNTDALPRIAKLKVGKYCYDVEIPFGTMIKCVSNGVKTVWTTGETGEILNVTGNDFTVCGTENAEFVIAENGKTQKISPEFSNQLIYVL